MVIRHIEGSLNGEPPFPPEITLRPRLGLSRNERHEVVALANLPADLLIPGLSAAKLAFVVPNFEAQRSQRIAKRPSGLAIS